MSTSAANAVSHASPKSIVTIPLVLITAFCFSYLQYASSGDHVSDAGRGALAQPADNSQPWAGAPPLTTAQSSLPLLNATVNNTRSLTNSSSSSVVDPDAQTPQVTAPASQGLQVSSSSPLITQKVSGSQHDSPKAKSLN